MADPMMAKERANRVATGEDATDALISLPSVGSVDSGVCYIGIRMCHGCLRRDVLKLTTWPSECQATWHPKAHLGTLQQAKPVARLLRKVMACNIRRRM